MTFRQVLLLGVLVACAALIVGQLYVTIPLGGDITRRFGVSLSAAAWSSSAYGFGYATGFMVLGPLYDRFGRSFVLTVGLFCTAVATAAVGFAPTFTLLLAFRAVQGLVAASFSPAALSLIAESLPAGQRALGISLMSLAFLTSAPLAQLFSARAGADLHSVMLELAPLYALGGLAVIFLRPRTGGSVGGVVADRKTIAALFRNPGLLAAWGASSTVLFSFVAFYAGAQTLGDTLGLDLRTLRLAGVLPLVSTLVAAALIRRFGAPTTARIGLTTASAGMLLAVVGTPTVLIVAGAVLAAGVGMTVPGLIASIAERATRATRGLAIAVYMFTIFTGASFGSPAAVALSHFGIVALCLLPAVLLGVAALLMARAGNASAPSTAE